MARRPDPPGIQAAKGNPGKRKSKVQKRDEATAKLAAMLAATPSHGNGVIEPPMLADPLFAPALAIWKDFAPELVRTNRLPLESRAIFAQFCVYYAEWVQATIDVAENGYSQRVKTIAGGYMERRRPVVDRRERAFDNVVKLSEHFGFTPHDLYDLFKDQARVAASHSWLFDREGTAPAQAKSEAAPSAPAPAGMIGSASRLRSEPPRGNA